MLTLDDCLAFSDLTPEEILAIAEHEHIPQVAALEMGNYLLSCKGSECIERMIADDIRDSQQHGNGQHTMELRKVLDDFVKRHPCG